MMGRIFTAALVALGATLGTARQVAADEARENAMQKFAEVMAIQNLCPDLTPNLMMMAVAGKMYGIDVSPGTADYDELLGRSKEEISKMREYGRVACIVGIANFGPNGSVVKDLLLEK